MADDINMGLEPVPTDILRHGFTEPKTDFGLSESSLIFPVSEFPLAAIERDGEGRTLDNKNIISQSRTHKAVVNGDSDEIVGVVSTKYKVLENMQFFTTVEQALRESIPESMLEGMMVRDKMSGRGAWCQREYVFPAFAEEISNSQYRTSAGFRVVAWNSYDGSASAGVLSGLIDFICTNGMIVGRDIAKELRRHSARLEPKLFVPRLRDNIEHIGENIAAIRHMANKRLDWDASLELLEKHFSGARAAQIISRTKTEAERRGETVQALHAALTVYSSHVTEGFGTRSDDPEREARTLRGREDEVMRLMSTKEWQELAA